MHVLRTEIRFAFLISLLMLLWLAVEFLIGLHDRFIAIHPYVTLLSFLIPLLAIWLALREKREEYNNRITFKQVLLSGAILSFIAAVLTIPTQCAFHFLINPDFFDNMITYSTNRAKLLGIEETQAIQNARGYFNLTSYLVKSFLGMLVLGVVESFILAWQMRTIK